MSNPGLLTLSLHISTGEASSVRPDLSFVHRLDGPANDEARLRVYANPLSEADAADQGEGKEGKGQREGVAA